MYNKTQRQQGNMDYIIQCLLDELSQVLVQYLVYIRPFARALPLDRRETEYLFGDTRGPWAGQELTEALSRATEKHLGVRLTVSGWRHVAIGIGTWHLAWASRTWGNDIENDGDAENGMNDFAEGDN